MKRVSLIIPLSLFFVIGSHAQLKVAIVGGGHQSKVLEDNNIPVLGFFKEKLFREKRCTSWLYG